MVGRKKKTKEIPKETFIVKYRCEIEAQYRDFDTQKEAIEMAKRILETDRVFFLKLSKTKIPKI